MKNHIISFIILLSCLMNTTAFAQDASINILMVPGTIMVNEKAYIKVDICNNSDQAPIPTGIILPTVSVPTASVEITGIDSSSNSGWTIFDNVDGTIRVENTEEIGLFECQSIYIGILGVTELDTRTITSTIQFLGPIPDDPNNNNSTTSVTVSGILPIELLSFAASAHQDVVDLDWETATELNNSHFEVQRSADGRSYTTIGEVKGAGTSSQVIGYTFTDEQPGSGKNYYRLKQVDYNGSFDYSPVRMVTLGADSRLSVFPNPVAPGSEITIQGQKIRTVKIYNMLGQIVVDKVYDHPQSSITISSGNLAQGIYTTRVNGVDEKRVVVK